MLTSGAGSQIDDSSKESKAEVRMIDNAEREAVLAQDLTRLEKYWAEEFVVNAPNNQVVRGRIADLELVRTGLIDYTVFERSVKELTVHGDTAIVMGLEAVKPKGKAPLTGHTVRRRFTNIWIRRDGSWQLTGRQATIIQTEQSPAEQGGGGQPTTK